MHEQKHFGFISIYDAFRVGEKERSWHSLSRILFAAELLRFLCSRGARFAWKFSCLNARFMNSKYSRRRLEPEIVAGR